MFFIVKDIAQQFGPMIKENNITDDFLEILEINKAFLASFAFIDFLKEQEVYTDENLIKKIKISSVLNMFLKEEPDINSPEQASKLIICNIFHEKNVYNMTDGKINIYEENISKVAKEALENVIQLLLDNNDTKAKEYYSNYTKWDDELNKISQIIKKYDNELLYEAENELADYLLNQE